MKRITTIKKIIFLSIMLITIIGLQNSVFALKAQTEKVLGIQKYQGITWTQLEGDKKETKVGEYVRYNPGIQSSADQSGIKYYNITEGSDKVSITKGGSGEYQYLQITGKKAGTAKINVYYLPIGNMKYNGIHKYSMKTLTVTVKENTSSGTSQGTGSNNTVYYNLTFLNSKGQNITSNGKNLILSKQAKSTFTMLMSPQELKDSGVILNEDISNYGEFEGWKNVSTGVIYKPGDTITINSNYIFKAQFKQKTVTNNPNTENNANSGETTNKPNTGNSNAQGNTSNNNNNTTIEKVKVNDTLTFTATSWKLYSDKNASNVKAYLLTGDKIKVLEVNDAKVPYILKVQVVSANKLKVGNTYYMKYGVTAKGNFKIEAAKENNVITNINPNGLIATLLNITKISLQTTINAGQQLTQVLQGKQENTETCEKIIEGIDALAKLGTQLFNMLFAKK